MLHNRDYIIMYTLCNTYTIIIALLPYQRLPILCSRDHKHKCLQEPSNKYSCLKMVGIRNELSFSEWTNFMPAPCHEQTLWHGFSNSSQVLDYLPSGNYHQRTHWLKCWSLLFFFRSLLLNNDNFYFIAQILTLQIGVNSLSFGEM